MRAAAATALSADDPAGTVDLVEVPEPSAGPGQTVVEVRAVALNRHDLWTIGGYAGANPALPYVLGSDVAGVTAQGREVVVHCLVADPARGGGDELLDPRRMMLADALRGGMAQRVVVPDRNLVDKPAGLSFAQAAALPTAWLTAYRMLFTRARCEAGQTVLVQGAGGGVSTALITLAANAGLHVWVAGRDPGRLGRTTALGAEKLFAAGEKLPARVDAVMDTVGGATWAHSLRSVRGGGTVVVAGATTSMGEPVPLDLVSLALRHVTVTGTALGTVEELAALLEVCADDGIAPVLDSVYPLADARAAVRRLAGGGVFGKVVVTP